MKVKQYTALLAILMTSGLINAQTTIPVGPPGLPGTITAPLTIAGNTTVNGTLTVQPAIATATTTNSVVGSGASTTIGGIVDNGAGSVIVNQTVLSNNTGTEITTGGGGATIATNGDATLAADSQATTNISYSRVVRFDVAQAGHTGPTPVGLPVPGTEQYFLLNSAGTPITPAFANQALLDAFVTATTPTALLALDPSIGATVSAPAGSGGNLVVEGNSTLGDAATDTTTVNGALVANNGLDATNDKITNLAAGTVATDAANLGQVNAGDATLQTNINNEATTRAAADTTLTTNLANEVTARTSADTTLTTNLANEVTARTAADATLTTNLANEVTARTNADTTLTTNLANEVTARTNADTTLTTNLANEVTARTAADTTLTTNLANEVTARTNADTAIRGEFAAADTALGTAVRSEFAAADTVERNARTAADTAIRGEFATADTALGGRIDSEISARIAGDTAVRSEFAAADTVERNARTAADTAIRGEFAAADTTERNARIAGDSSLQSNIDENTRGIAMVAAMTNTQVEAGKTHGVDFNMAQFQSETGFGFGYANRINENVQVHTSVASTTDFDESVVRVGVAYQW